MWKINWLRMAAFVFILLTIDLLLRLADPELNETFSLLYPLQQNILNELLLGLGGTGIFITSYLLSAAGALPRFPLVRGVLVSVTIYTSLWLPFALVSLYGFYSGELEHIENTPYRTVSALGFQTVVFALLLLALIVGIKQSWNRLKQGSDWRLSLTLILGFFVGFELFGLNASLFGLDAINPKAFEEWIVNLAKQYSDTLNMLPGGIDFSLIIILFCLPKLLLLSVGSTALVSYTNRPRAFIYSILFTYIFMRFIFHSLPFINLLQLDALTRDQIEFAKPIVFIIFVLVFIGMMKLTKMVVNSKVNNPIHS
ncbi:hypothetical protein [Shewanella atlantica]|uniref:hypothetical protein n=1 Tax=Shewanella atlantica TaxID=271099 RepID=UPI0037361CEE